MRHTGKGCKESRGKTLLSSFLSELKEQLLHKQLINLKWLKLLSNETNQIINRSNFGLKFPVEKVIIAEGITEEILLPKFAQICGYILIKTESI